MKKILCILFCLLPVLGGKAQTLYRDQVRIEKESITRSEDNNVLTINLDIVLQENLKFIRNRINIGHKGTDDPDSRDII